MSLPRTRPRQRRLTLVLATAFCCSTLLAREPTTVTVILAEPAWSVTTAQSPATAATLTEWRKRSREQKTAALALAPKVESLERLVAGAALGEIWRTAWLATASNSSSPSTPAVRIVRVEDSRPHFANLEKHASRGRTGAPYVLVAPAHYLVDSGESMRIEVRVRWGALPGHRPAGLATVRSDCPISKDRSEADMIRSAIGQAVSCAHAVIEGNPVENEGCKVIPD